MSFIDKVKEIVSGFLATENSKYITTEGGLKIMILDRGFRDRSKNDAESWGEKANTDINNWSDKPKTS